MFSFTRGAVVAAFFQGVFVAIVTGDARMAQKLQAMTPGTIWKGMGRKQQIHPTSAAYETEYRFICHRLGSKMTSPRKRSVLTFLRSSRVGRYFFNCMDAGVSVGRP